MQLIPVHVIGQFRYKGIDRDIYANTITIHLHEHGYNNTPHKHDFYASIFISCGCGTHEIDFITYPVKPGSVFLLSPGQVHSWNVSPDIEGYIIYHTKEFYNLNYYQQQIDQFPFFSKGANSPLISGALELKGIEPVFQDIVSIYKSEELMRLQQICSLLNVLYIRLSNLYQQGEQQTSKSQDVQLHRLEDFIDNHYKISKLPKQYAELMNMSQKNLNRIVKLSLGKTISVLISDRIMLEAKRMLIHSAFSVSEIAFELGYFENPYFFRIFKKRSGITPTAYMNKFRK